MVTSHDVARLAGVSQPTVSRALRDSPRVSEETKRRVRTAAATLGYVPSATGRALSMGRSNRVGLLLTDLENQFYPHIIAPMHQALEALGYELMLMTESSDTGPVAERVAANNLDGVILATTTIDSLLPVRLRDRDIPFVYFNRTADTVAADAVTVDPEQGVHELVAALVQQGHSRVGAIFGPQNTSTGEARETALRRRLSEEGLSLAAADVRQGPFEFDTGLVGARELLSSSDHPSVILCGNDVVGMGALNAAAELGIAVPGGVSIVGFDDLPTSRWALIQLSTVAYDLNAMARRAATFIVDRVEGGPDQPYQVATFPTTYVPRATLAPPPD